MYETYPTKVFIEADVSKIYLKNKLRMVIAVSFLLFKQEILKKSICALCGYQF